MRSALSRFSTPRTSSTSRTSSRSIVGAAGLDLGSTASSLPGGGGGSGGGGVGDFSLTLQSLVKPGSRVKKGQVVAEFDRQYMLIRLDDFRASQQQLEASLESLKANLEVEKKAHNQTIQTAKASLDKAELDLKTVPVRSANDTERLRLAAEEEAANFKRVQGEVKSKDASQAAQLKIAYLERDQQRIELQRYEANTDRMVIKAPIDGITVMGTTLRGGEIGQIQAGDQVHPGMMFMRVVDPSSMVINANVNQADIEQIRVGLKARVRFDAYPELELPAHVYSIGAISKNVGAGFRASYVKEVPVAVKLDKMDPRVIPDLSVSIDVLLGSESGAVIAPLAAVFRDGGKPYVFVQGATGWERRDVEFGLTNNVAAVIRAGLRPGEVIALEWPLAEKKK